ncbi:hypothetical protein ABMA27_003638 [Loxostege sticticalis]|uniref:Uncharacterized protein n=1 Tax=Loxostege sticticalis TaxID=481309 RepID=A0ABR3HPS5_LOXSC
MFHRVLSIILFGFFACSVKGDFSNELQKKFVGYLGECWQTHELTPKDLEDLKMLKMPDSENVKCYFACVYKKAEMMNDKGEFWEEGVKKTSLQQYGNDDAMLKKVNDFIDICKKVNDEPVTDGEKGCERAALMFKCSNEHAPEFGFI